eukprot:CAMPEP_0197247646 /NCGR_PEP_ID=MMETSP1429-20130617/30542_1 /TAXON_ID=49237 /ORGANISM="Chaetoceros  sp., Strain UNC1202" /LENGTH=230 /DNA_ID=CAMNT_0042708603 /DNA_START=157 /DNA_END=849 /DNA_ORIENTATION=+
MKYLYSLQSALILSTLFFEGPCLAWVAAPSSPTRGSPLQMAIGIKLGRKGKKYEPKWKKRETLADKEANVAPQDKGIVGTIPVVFKCGEATISTLASPGDPIKDIASQAGQYIQYGCGKGECGTCQSMCNGQYIKPCVAVVPGDILAGEEYVIQVAEVKNKAKSSGKFYSVRSFLFGFYNNVLGMYAFVFTRKAANKNFDERMDFETMIAQKAEKKRAAREAAKQKEANM